MKKIALILMITALLICPVISAYDSNMTPIILSFSGGHVFGENPVLIMNNETGQIVFLGNTSSRNITLQPDIAHILRVEPAGLTDTAHSPDNAFVGVCEWVEKNPIGYLAVCIILSIFISAWRRKVN